MENAEMGSSKPYLLRALHQWILDNGLTPHIIVDVQAQDVDVPAGAEKDGRLVLNIAPRALRNLDMGNEAFSFEARFAGAPHHVRVPVAAILAIYARENGQGMVFARDEAGAEDPAEDNGRPDGDKRGGPNLRVIK